MYIRTRRLLFVVGIVVILIVGIVMVVLWQQCYSADTMGTQSNEATESSFALDAEYASSYLKATSNYDKCEVNRQYSEKWKQEAEYYVQKICEIADEDLKQALIAAQAAWENSYQMRMDENLAYLQYVYTSGTIIPILHSKYGYDLQRERAIELCEIYNSVKSVWEVIQRYGE